MNIALFGGSFDPPHMGHQLVCLYLLEGEGFDRVWLVPCYRHAFGKDLAPFEHRVAMCGLLAKPFGGRVVVSKVEQALSGDEGNRTIDTLLHLKTHHPEHDYTLVVGSDILSETAGWKDFDRLKEEAGFLVLRRTGFDPPPADWRWSSVAFPEVSSTEIRERLARGEASGGLVPSSVGIYVSDEELYL